MTQNQIAYWKLQEEIRSNKAKEGETHRSNVAQEYIGLGNLGETQRHNIVTEGISLSGLGETQRSNRAQESLKEQSLVETERSNRAKEAETERSNRAREAETERSNMANEYLKHETNTYNREVGLTQANVTRMHNEAMEALQAESIRNDYELGYMNNELGWQQLGETERSNLAREAETERSNKANEKIKELGQGIRSVGDFVDIVLKVIPGVSNIIDTKYQNDPLN